MGVAGFDYDYDYDYDYEMTIDGGHAGNTSSRPDSFLEEAATAGPPPGRPEWLDGQPRAVDPAWVTVTRLVGAVWVAVLAVSSLVPVLVLSLVALESALPRALLLLAWLLAFVVLAVLSFLWPVWSYRHLRWWLDSQGMHIRRGVLWREEVAVPRNRIQHTDVSNGPLDRSYGLSSLILHTAGTENASVTLGGLPHTLALELRDLLLEGGEDDGV